MNTAVIITGWSSMSEHIRRSSRPRPMAAIKAGSPGSHQYCTAPLSLIKADRMALMKVGLLGGHQDRPARQPSVSGRMAVDQQSTHQPRKSWRQSRPSRRAASIRNRLHGSHPICTVVIMAGSNGGHQGQIARRGYQYPQLYAQSSSVKRWENSTCSSTSARKNN